ncbi:hypothetical protein ACL9RI_11055 [Janthinobacterium sp. Mn2066]|uniref:hypothetical protein n=1 Tax=Janthinobacterium sp. Mn2066 TaxID=3395264 RepID=UPI003BBA240D
MLSATMVEGEAAEEAEEDVSVRFAPEAGPDDGVGVGVVFQLESAEIEVIALPFH